MRHHDVPKFSSNSGVKQISLQELRQRIGGTCAITWATFFILTPLAQLSNLSRLSELNSAHQLSFALLSLVVFFIAIAMARSFFRLRKPETVSPLWLVFIAYGLISLTRWITPLIAVKLQIIPSYDLSITPLIQSVVSGILLFSLVAFAMDYLTEQRQTIASLSIQSQRLAVLRSGASANLAQTTKQVQDAIHTELSPSFDEVLKALSSALDRNAPQDDLRRLAQSVRIQLREAVQRLSRRLANESVTTEPAPTTSTTNGDRFRFKQFIRQLPNSEPISPLANSLLMFLLFLWAWIYAAGIRGFFILCITSILGFGVLLLGKNAMRLLSYGRLLVWLVSILGVGSLFGGANIWIAQMSQENTAEITSPMLAPFLVQVWCGIVIAVIATTSYRQKITTRSLEAANKSYRLESAGLQQATEAILKKSGNLLHGSIQGRLVANALRLDLAAQISIPEERVSMTEQTYTDIESLSFEMQNITNVSATQGTLQNNLEVIAAQWNGIVDVTIDPIESQPELLNVDLLSAISEVVREGINNAAKHAGARTVEVIVTFSATNVQIVVSNDHRGIPDAQNRDPRPVDSLDRNLPVALEENQLIPLQGSTHLRVVLPLSTTESAKT